MIYGWKLMPPRFTRDFQRTLLEIPAMGRSGIRLRACHPLRAASSTLLGLPEWSCTGLTTPHFPSLSGGIRIAVFRIRSPLLTESRLISFPPPTKMLHFGGYPLLTEFCVFTQNEVTFGDPGIKVSLRLHRAYRCLARPSSAPEPSHSPSGFCSRT